MLILELNYDQDVECPIEGSGWQFVSFHRNSSDKPSDHIETVDRSGSVTFANIGLARKVECGTAFILSRYGHSGEQWGLRGEVHQCRFDTADIAGMLIWKDKVKYLPHVRGDKSKTYALRAERARSEMVEYTDWCNGECYRYRLIERDDTGKMIWYDSCGGYIGAEGFAKYVRELVKGRKIDQYLGEAQYMADCYDFVGKPLKVLEEKIA